MGSRLFSIHSNQRWFSPFVDVAINGMAAMFIFLAVYVAAVPPTEVRVIPLKLLTTHVPAAVWYKPYETAICVTGGRGGYVFQFEPKGQFNKLSLFCDPNSGLISGTPKSPTAEDRLKPYNLKFRVTVSDHSRQSVADEFELRITPVAIPFDPERQPLVLAVEPNEPNLPDAWTNRPYEYTPPIRGGIEAYELKWEGLPPGFESDSKGRVFSRTVDHSAVPSDAQAKGFKDYIVQLIVTDQQSALFPALAEREPQLSREFYLRVHLLRNISLTSVLPAVRAGQQYKGAIVARGGKQRLIWQSDDLDHLRSYGFTLDPYSGLITAESVMTSDATRVVRVSFQVRVIDPSGAVESKSIKGTIQILPSMHFRIPD